jgi:hypothetical protein
MANDQNLNPLCNDSKLQHKKEQETTSLFIFMIKKHHDIARSLRFKKPHIKTSLVSLNFHLDGFWGSL